MATLKLEFNDYKNNVSGTLNFKDISEEKIKEAFNRFEVRPDKDTWNYRNFEIGINEIISLEVIYDWIDSDELR